MVERDEYDRVELPDHIYTTEDAADAALALVEHFDSDSGYQNDHLAHLANVIQSVCRARAQEVDDTSRYGARVTFIDREGDPHTGIVLEPEVASLGIEEAWDPYREEMVTPQEAYPLGTVQLIYPSGGAQWGEGFFFDRKSNLEVATSVVPARDPEDTYCYYAGWEYALESADGAESGSQSNP